MIERIARLLALAEGASTTEEAEAAFAMAQKLASRYSVDLAVAQAQHEDKAKRETPITRTFTIGERGKRTNGLMVLLFTEIARANDVSVLIASNSTKVYPTGFPSDLDVVEALWSSLALTMTRFADQLVRDKNAAWRSETVRVWDDREWTYVEKPVTGQGARRAFSEGFINRIGERLREARKAAVQEAEARHFHDTDDVRPQPGSDTLPSSMALVLREKKAEVDQAQDSWYKERHGNRRPGSWRGGSSTARHSTSAHTAGRAAADRTSLAGRRAVGA